MSLDFRFLAYNKNFAKKVKNGKLIFLEINLDNTQSKCIVSWVVRQTNEKLTKLFLKKYEN